MIKHFIFIFFLSTNIIFPQRGNIDFFKYPDPVGSSFIIQNPGFDSTTSFIKVTGETDNKKTIIKWSVDNNNEVDQFEVEKWTGGNNYKLVALVFASEKTAAENYWFVDKAQEKPVKYRVKLITKTKKEIFSKIIVVKPTEQ